MQRVAFLKAGYLGRDATVMATLSGLLWAFVLTVLFGFASSNVVWLAARMIGVAPRAFEYWPPGLHLLAGLANAWVLLGAVALVAGRWLGRDLRSLVTMRPRFRWQLLVEAALVWLVLRLLVETALRVADGGGAVPAQFDVGRFLFWLPAAIAFALIQVGAEEIVFRGFVLQSFARVLPAGPSIVLASVVWAEMHGQYGVPGKVSLALTGVLLAWLAVRDDGLERAIGLHVGHNLLFFTLFTGTGSPVFEAQPGGATFGTGWTHPAATFVLIALFLLVSEKLLPRLRRWRAMARTRVRTQESNPDALPDPVAPRQFGA